MERPTSSGMQVLYAELAAVRAQNARLEEENLLLRHRLECASNDQHTNDVLSVEAKIGAFQMEEERDRILKTLQQHKKRYNQLHNAYVEKMRRCKALEEMFKRQKTLTGLVMKSEVAQRNSEQQMMLEKRRSQQSTSCEAQVKQLEAKLAKVQSALDESYDTIDDMNFELESVEAIELQNQSLREELATLKAQLAATTAATATGPAEETPPDADSPPPEYQACSHQQQERSSICEDCLSIDDADAQTLERAALTTSLIQSIESDTNCLRREFLRSRCQRARLEKEKEKQSDDQD